MSRPWCKVGNILLLACVAACTSVAAQTTAQSDLASWAQQPQIGPEGRALPVCGTWSSSPSSNGWNDRYLRTQIEEGHHVLFTLEDPDWLAMTRGWTYEGGRNFEQHMDLYYRPAMQYARDHQLPIAFRGWNWDNRIMEYDDWFVNSPDAQTPKVLKNGKPVNLLDPFGPIQPWQTWGRFYCGHDVLRELQAIYPNPPLVIFLNNNEGSKITHASEVSTEMDRYRAKYGNGPFTHSMINQAVRDGYRERWAAAFEAARGALIEPAWKKNVRFVSYNVLWETAAIGSGSDPKPPQPGIWYHNEKGWLDWTVYDGAMPELYDNDWQPGKTDHTPVGMQMEAMNYFAAKERILREQPDYLWTSITWDGGVPNQAWSGHRPPSKTFQYITRGQRWDAARHEGWIQFCLWTTRPSIYFEFRGQEPRDTVRLGTWQALMECVDRPWKNATLREFWRKGILVPNTLEPEGHFYNLGPDHPQWLKDMDRWFLLTCDANPPRANWDCQTTHLRVFSVALVLGIAPERRWLIYAHAPLGAVRHPTVTLPRYGDVQLPSVPKSGSFFLFEEQERSVQTLIAGGPSQLALSADRLWASPGEEVTYTAAIAHAPEQTLHRVTWDFGDGTTLAAPALERKAHRFAKAGNYLVTVTSECADGSKLSEQVATFVGAGPPSTVAYELPLDDAFDWQGPWADPSGRGEGMLTYRHLPNRGSAPNPIVVGGRFVNDPARGRVWELTEEDNGIFLMAGPETNSAEIGHPDKTLSLWFKAGDVVGRQVLYAEGSHFPNDDRAAGYNLYLDGATLYAGSWATRKKHRAWASSEGIQPGRWYHVTLMLKDATEEAQPDRLRLFIDGRQVATAPGVRIPGAYGPPRIGRTRLGGASTGESLTLFHDQKLDENRIRDVRTFRGRIDDFRLITAATEP